MPYVVFFPNIKFWRRSLRLILGSTMIQIMGNLPVTAEDLPAIEAEMMKIVKEK